MVTQSQKWKLSSAQKLFVCRLLAEFKSDREIMEALDKEYGVKVDISNIQWYRNRKNYANLVNKIREEYLGGLLNVPIAQKRIRLERLEQKYHGADKIEELEKRMDYQLRCLERAREEVEGPKRGKNRGW